MNISPDKGTCVHEAAHVAYAVMCGQIPESVTVDRPEEGVLGRVTHDRNYGVNPDTGRDHIIGALLGSLVEGERDWLPKWPLSPKAGNGDARLIAQIAQYLELEKEDWDWVVRFACHYAATEEFKHLVRLISYALGRLGELDQEQLRFLIGPDVARRYGIAPATEETSWST